MSAAKEALQKQQKGNTTSATTQMNAMLVAMQKEIAKALPKHIQSDRFQRVALTAFSDSEALQRCTPISFISSMMKAAQLGLEPNTPLGHAYLIPYENQVTLVIGYRGMIDLAMRSGLYQSIEAHAVHENDLFSMDYGLDRSLSHRPSLSGDRGDVLGYYGIYRLVNGGYGFLYMSKEEVKQWRDKYSPSSKKKDSPWIKEFDEMAKKTVIRRMLKYAPMSSDMKAAETIDEKSPSESLTARDTDVFVPAGFTELKEPSAGMESQSIDPDTGEIKEASNSFFTSDFQPIDEGVL